MASCSIYRQQSNSNALIMKISQDLQPKIRLKNTLNKRIFNKKQQEQAKKKSLNKTDRISTSPKKKNGYFRYTEAVSGKSSRVKNDLRKSLKLSCLFNNLIFDNSISIDNICNTESCININQNLNKFGHKKKSLSLEESSLNDFCVEDHTMKIYPTSINSLSKILSYKEITSEDIKVSNNNEEQLTRSILRNANKVDFIRHSLSREKSSQRKVKFLMNKSCNSFDYYYQMTNHDKVAQDTDQNTARLSIKRLNNKNQKTHQAPFKKKVDLIEGLSNLGYSASNDSKINQDVFLVIDNYLKEHPENESYFISVINGYGLNGHLVSNFISRILPNELRFNLGEIHSITDSRERNDLITKTFNEINKKLIETKIDVSQSGAICCSIILTHNSIICINLGNSRAVTGRLINSKWWATELSRDHNLDNIREKPRITKQIGRIQPHSNNLGVRIHKPVVSTSSDNFPQILVTRSFGNTLSESFGIISEPEIKELTLSSYDKFVIIASNALWQYITSNQCIQIISAFYHKKDIKGALEFIHKEANCRMIKKGIQESGDITVALVFFE